MKYIDSSVFIGAFLSSNPNHKICREVVGAIIRDRLPAAISVFGLNHNTISGNNVSNNNCGITHNVL